MSKEIVKYIGIGLLTVLLSFAVYSLGLFLGLGIVFSNSVATFIAMAFAFLAQKYWVFEAKSKKFMKEISLFALGRLFTYGLETFLILMLVQYLGIHPLLSKGLTQVLVVMGNYCISRIFVFR